MEHSFGVMDCQCLTAAGHRDNQTVKLILKSYQCAHYFYSNTNDYSLLGAPTPPTVLNMTLFDQPSYCMDNNQQTVCTNIYGTHPYIIFDLATPLATVPSLQIQLG
jgi:hypothetical protein